MATSTSLHLVSSLRLPVVSQKKSSKEDLPSSTSQGQTLPSRRRVLNACLITSGGIAAAGFAIRQGSHSLADFGYWSSDCSTLMSYDFDSWHLLVTAGLVASVSGLRFTLLKLWPDFAQSSETANKRILSSLQPLDCVAIAFASGISEELLFRGALLPLVGMNSTGALISGTVFGALHITGGRNIAFATWASLVGILYGVAAVWTSDLSVPMLAHSLANLVAALLWKYNRRTDKRVEATQQNSNEPLT